LCSFLEQPVPDEPFPEGNVAAEFYPKIMVIDKERFRHAYSNAAMLATMVVLGVSAVMAWKLQN